MLNAVLLGLAYAPGTIVAGKPLGTLTLAQAKGQAAKLFPLGAPKITNGVRLISIRYRSSDHTGLAQEVSGLLAIPVGKKSRGLIMFGHGTIADRTNVPSQMTPLSDKGMEAPLATLAFAAGGYATFMPDYLGLGVNAGVHPFGQKVNAIACIDGIKAAQEWAVKNQVDLNGKLFISGYSEGGGISMWTSRLLTEQGTKVTASAHLAGPYDLSGTMAKHVVAKTLNVVDRMIRIYFMAYFAHGVQAMDANADMDSLFVPSFAAYLPTAFDKAGKEKDYQQRIATKAVQVGGLASIQRVLQPEAINAFRTGRSDFWALGKLRESDCFNWRTTSPMLLTGLTTDKIVPFANAELASRTMKPLAPGLVTIQPIVNAKLNHVTAAPLALRKARDYFDRH